ncbi:MAG TPA: hypothetical protein VMU41_08580, partial [Candidatus Binataceae bacterium]|nr:hypothetical protein [Candidatus Binataceae bacterium]
TIPASNEIRTIRISRLAACGVMICFALSSLLSAQARAEEIESAHSFVQRFYDWYVPEALSRSFVSPEELALKQRNSDFAPQLAAALREDLAAQAKSPDEIVGLDFDPFLNSQDPCEHYKVGTITRKGGTYTVRVYAVCSDKQRNAPDVAAELSHWRNGWQFINFRYPNLVKPYPRNANLLSILKALRAQRSAPAAPH